MIAIADYGVGNLASVKKALAAVGAEAVLTREPAVLAKADGIVIPGVGNFGHCSREFHRYDLAAPLREARARGVPLLGICVGMQLFFAGSEEDAGAPGLGFLPGTVVRMRPPGLRVPQIGWNALRLTGAHPWLTDTRDGDHFYFVHSYVPEAGGGVTLGTVDYGGPRCAAAGAPGILGVQFHPEKSGANGLRLLRAFVRAIAPAVRA